MESWGGGRGAGELLNVGCQVGPCPRETVKSRLGGNSIRVSVVQGKRCGGAPGPGPGAHGLRVGGSGSPVSTKSSLGSGFMGDTESPILPWWGRSGERAEGGDGSEGPGRRAALATLPSARPAVPGCAGVRVCGCAGVLESSGNSGGNVPSNRFALSYPPCRGLSP